jgi:energy-coupling factor transporter ATP-binding protein EcfA2
VVQPGMYKDAGREGLRRRWMSGEGSGQATENWRNKFPKVARSLDMLDKILEYTQKNNRGILLIGAGVLSVGPGIHWYIYEYPKREIERKEDEKKLKQLNDKLDPRRPFEIKSDGVYPLDLKKELKEKIKIKRFSGDWILVYGPGDAGKTTLVKDAVVELWKDEKRFMGWYFGCTNDQKEFYKELKRLHKSLFLEHSEQKDIQEIVVDIKNALVEKKGFVIIFDNVEDISNMYPKPEDLIYPDSKGLFILTTRDSSWKVGNLKLKPDEKFPVDSLKMKEAKEIFLKYLNHEVRTKEKVDDVRAEKILEVVGTYVGTLKRIMEELNNNKRNVDELLEPGPDGNADVGAIKKYFAVPKSKEKNPKSLIELNPSAWELLYQVAFLCDFCETVEQNGVVFYKISYEFLELLKSTSFLLSLSGTVPQIELRKMKEKQSLEGDVITLSSWVKPKDNTGRFFFLPKSYRDAIKSIYTDRNYDGWFSKSEKDKESFDKKCKSLVELIDKYKNEQGVKDLLKGYEKEIDILRKLDLLRK